MAQQTLDKDSFVDQIQDHPEPETAREQFGHLNRYEVLDPWDNDSRLLICETDGVVVGQIYDDSLQLVKLAEQDLRDLTLVNCGILEAYTGSWHTFSATAMPLSGWDGKPSQVIGIVQEKFGKPQRAALTKVDVAEILAAVDC